MRHVRSICLSCCVCLCVPIACARDFDAPFRETGLTEDSGGGSSGKLPDGKVPGNGPIVAEDGGLLPGLDGSTPEPRCDLTKPFGEAHDITELNTDDEEASARLSPDELTIFFSTDRQTVPRFRVWSATRTSTTEPFGAPALLADDAEATLVDIAVGPNGLTAFLQRTPNAGSGAQIVTASRAELGVPFGTGTAVADLDVVGQVEGDPYLMPDGSLIFARTSAAMYDIFVAKPNGNGGFTASPIDELNGPNQDRDPIMSNDGLEVMFSSNRDGTGFRLFRATRATADGVFSMPVVIGELATGAGAYEAPTWLSPDRCVLYFASNRKRPKSDIFWTMRGK